MRNPISLIRCLASLPLVLSLAGTLACSAKDTAATLPADASTPVEKVDPSAFIVKGTSGKDVLVDRRWDRGCVRGTNAFGEPVWQDYERTLTGLELVVTQKDFQNDSPTPDCKTGRVEVRRITQVLTNNKALIPFTWVDAEGKKSPAPAGLEGVMMCNSVSAKITVATQTLETKELVDQFNKEKACTFTDWAVGVPHDVLACFTEGAGPLPPGGLIVDDRTTPWAIYDGEGDPAKVPNFAPHHGPFDGPHRP